MPNEGAPQTTLGASSERFQRTPFFELFTPVQGVLTARHMGYETWERTKGQSL